MYHEWGDETFDWRALAAAGEYIRKYVRRYSLCSLMYKEKYGSLRYEWIFPPYGGIYIYMRSKIYRWWNHCWLYRKWTNLGWLVLKRAVFNAIEKWPHIKDELLSDLAANEKLVGTEIHKKYWTSV